MSLVRSGWLIRFGVVHNHNPQMWVLFLRNRLDQPIRNFFQQVKKKRMQQCIESNLMMWQPLFTEESVLET